MIERAIEVLIYALRVMPQSFQRSRYASWSWGSIHILWGEDYIPILHSEGMTPGAKTA